MTAAIRAAGCGLPPSLLAAVTYRRPAPPTHPTRPHHDRYAHVTGPRGAASPTPGKLREAREPNRRSLWLLTEPRCRAAASVSGIRGRPGGVGRARGAPGSHGALRVSCHGEQRAPWETLGCGPALASALSLFLGLSSRVLLRGSRLAPRAGLGATCCKVSGPRRMNPRTGH